jgi:hypothetical protein
VKKLYVSLVFFVCFYAVNILPHEKIKLYALYTPSHEVLKDKFFLPSLQDDFEVIFEFCEQTCQSVKFMSEGWTDTTIRKVDLIIRAIKENWGSIFIFSDVDIQFFRPIQEAILEHMQDKDMVIQRNTPSGVLCSGFFACRGNEKTLRLWEDVKKTMEQDNSSSDQISLNRCIKRSKKKNPYSLSWDYLPDTFFGGGTLTGCLWNPGMVLPIPHNIMIHHANWTRGIKNKIAQLVYVREEVLNRKKRLSKR